MGTRIENLQVTKVVDGDTIKVQLADKQESLRLTGIDTEESQPAGATADKPVTAAGRAASALAKQYFASPGGALPRVTIEFDTDDPAQASLAEHRDNYGRLLCYVHMAGENYNVKLVKEGWSPYFVKYGRSRLYHEELTGAEAEAQANSFGIWNPATNAGGPSRPYGDLLPWWASRASVVEDFRKLGDDPGVLSVRLDYPELIAASETSARVTVFCDLQEGAKRSTEGGVAIFAGSVFHKFNLWIPDPLSDEAARILRLVRTRYAGRGRGYVYVTGTVTRWGRTPQIVLTDPTQLSDFPPTP